MNGPVNCNRAMFMRNRRSGDGKHELIPDTCQRCGTPVENIAVKKSLCPFMDVGSSIHGQEPFVYKPQFTSDKDKIPPEFKNVTAEERKELHSYAEAPPSITELRSLRDGDGRKQTPRDVLIRVLRDLDAGKINPDAMFVAWREPCKDDPNNRHIGFEWAGPDVDIGLAVAYRATKIFAES